MATSGDTSSIYADLPLDPSAEAIRTLNISPGFWPQEIKVTLNTISLSGGAPFEALSYTWGASTLGRCITVNDAYELPVTDNLFNALRCLRRCFSTRILWVDKVCINQDDLEERARQVAIMDVIYKRASAVNVWLGEYGWMFPLTFKCRLPARDARVSWTLHRWRLWFDCVRNRPAMIDKAILGTTVYWHERAWTVQEFIVARNVYLCFGGVRLKYTAGDLDFMVHDCVLSWVQSLHQFRRLNAAMIALFHFSYKLHRKPSNQGKATEFQGLLTRSAQLGYDRNAFGIIEWKTMMDTRNATDPRDQIYSVSALINTDEAALIGIDYKLPCSQVYARATFASIVTRGDFDIFLLLCTYERSTDYPTWYVDFSVYARFMRFVQPLAVGRKRNLAGGDGLAEAALKVSLQDACRRLSLLVIPVDQVCKTVPLPTATKPIAAEEFCDLFRRAIMRLEEYDSPKSMAQSAPLPKLLSKVTCSEEPVAQEILVQSYFQKLSRDGYIPHLLDINYWYIFRLWSQLTGLYPHGTSAEQLLDARYCTGIRYAIESHRRNNGSSALFITTSGLIGLAPGTVMAGDTIVQVRSREPFIVLRRSGSFDTFEGHVMLHGLYNPRTLKPREVSGVPQQEIILC